MIKPPWNNPEFAKKNVQEKVYPVADLRYNERAKIRKFDNLLGIEPHVEKKELVNEVEIKKPLTELEQWNIERARAIERSSENSTIAFKRDEGAWADEDGYAQVKETPKFRVGYNNIEFIKPLQPAHLHNGLKLLPDSIRASSNVIASVRSSDAIHRKVSKRADLAQAVGAYFMRGISSGSIGLLDSRNSIKESDRNNGEILLLLRTLEEAENAPADFKDFASVEKSKRSETLAQALGNVFVSIGMTLPAGKREDPRRNDSVALKLGSSIMAAEHMGGRSELPFIEESLRKEVAIALGRALLHLRAAAGIEGSRSLEGPKSDHSAPNDLKVKLGRLTLQLLENSAARAGKMITKDPVRREILANALGSTVIQMEAMSTHRNKSTDRNKVELLHSTRVPGPAPQNGLHLKTAEPAVKRMNIQNSTELKRVLLPTREVAPIEFQNLVPINDRKVKNRR